MAKIPQLDIQTVKPQIPNVNVPSAPRSSGLGELSAGMMQFGQALTNKQTEMDNLDAENATNYKRDDQKRLFDEAFEKKGNQVNEPDPNGEDPNLSLKDSLLARYDEDTAFQSAELSPGARQRFERNAERLRVELEYGIDKHIASQQNVIYEQSYQDRDNAEIKHLVNFGVDKDSLQPDGAIIGQSEARRLAAAEEFARFNGTDPKAAKEAVRANTKLLIMESLLTKESPAVETYWNLYKEELNPKDRLRLEPIIADKKNYWVAAKEVPKLIEKYNIPGTNLFDINALRTDVDLRPGMNEKLRNEMMSFATSKLSLIERSNNLILEANANKVIGSFVNSGGSAAVATNTAEFGNIRQISEARAVDLRNTLYAWEKAAQEERAGLKDPNRWMSQNATLWAVTQDPNRVQAMTEDQVFDPALMLVLGQKNHADLVERWTALRTPEGQRKLTDVSMKKEELEDVFVAGGLGIKPKGEKKQTEWLSKKAALRELIEGDIRSEQLAKNRQLTEPERNVIYKKWTNKIRVDKDRWFFGLIPGFGQQEFYGYQRPDIVLSETAYQDMNAIMVKNGLLPALKPGEALSNDRKQAIQKHLLNQTPRPISEKDVEEARQRAAQPAASQVPAPPASAAPTPVPAPAPKQPSQISRYGRIAGKYVGNALMTPFQVVTPWARVPMEEFQPAQYQQAIHELVAGKQLAPLGPGQNYSNEEWNRIKDYLRKRGGR